MHPIPCRRRDSHLTRNTEIDRYVQQIRQCPDTEERRSFLEVMIAEDKVFACAVVGQLLLDGPNPDLATEVLGLVLSHRLKVDREVVSPLLEAANSVRVRRAAIPALGFLGGPSAFRDIAPFLTHDDPGLAGAAVEGLLWFPAFSARRLESMVRSAGAPAGLGEARIRFSAAAEAAPMASADPEIDVAFFLRDAAGANTAHIEVRGSGFWNVPGQNSASDFQTTSTETDDAPSEVSSGALFQSATMYTGTMQQPPLADDASFAILVSIRGSDGQFIDSFGVEIQSKAAGIVASLDEVALSGTLPLDFHHDTGTDNTIWFVSGDKARFVDSTGVEHSTLGQAFGGVLDPVSLRGKSAGFFNETAVRLALAFGLQVDLAFRRFTVGSTLPGLATDDGLVARLLIAESRLPGDAGYDAAQGRIAMQAMRAAVDNRLRNGPGRFGAPSATGVRDIILAPGQFPGFSGTPVAPVLAAGVQANIDRILALSDPGLTAQTYQFVQDLLGVVNGPVTDPFAQVTEVDGEALDGKTYAWTADSDAPLPAPFVKIPAASGGVVAGRQFYGRKKRVPLDAFLEFRTYNPVTKLLEALPAGIAVDLVDRNAVLPDTTLQSGSTDASGRVEFHIFDTEDLPTPNPDVYFLVRPGTPNPLGVPGEWSTQGWKAADGSPGFFPGFSGQPIGTSSQPLVFSIGVDVHLKVIYSDRSVTPAVAKVAAPMIRVRFVQTLGSTANQSLREIQVLRTDDDGEVHGVLLDIGPEQAIAVQIAFETDDSSINLIPTSVSMPQSSPFSNQAWITTLDASITTTSLGTVAAPLPLTTVAMELDAAFYMLKLLREFQTFFVKITDGDWKWSGVGSLTISLAPLDGFLDNAFSFPRGRVNFPEKFYFNRGTIIHELTHQVFWVEAAFSTLGIGFAGVFGNIQLHHHTRMLSNEEHALIEGWPEFIQAVFIGPDLMMWSPCFSGSFAGLDPFKPPNGAVFSASGTPPSGCLVVGQIEPPPLNQGQQVEGALAVAMLRVYRRFVIAGADPGGDGEVAETASDGDVSATEPWLDDPLVRERFKQLFWQPLIDIAPLTSPTTSDLMEKTQARNSSTWHQIRAELNALRVAMSPPTLTGVTPASAPAGAILSLTLTGDGFVVGMGVTVGGMAATNIQVTASTTLTADSPALALGTYEVSVVTLGGAATLAGALTVT